MKNKPRFGFGFADQLNKVAFKYGHFHKNKDTQDWQDNLILNNSAGSESTVSISDWRRFIYLIVLIIVFSALFFRLFQLQVVQGKYNRELADSNRIQIKIIHAPRGVIYDRNGKILAQNEPGFRLIENSPPTKPQARIISRDEALKMEIDGDPNYKNLEVDSLRNYPLGEKTAHILGYVGEISEEELKKPSFKNYKLGDIVGRSGVEQYYEKFLKGVDGGEIIEVDAQGKKLRTITETKPIPGQNLVLSLDSDLQLIAYQKLEEALKKTSSCCGAVIVQDPNSGQILAMISMPSYNPKNISLALNAPNSPILNRAIGGIYPPGSTYKIASSLAGLSSGKITPKTVFEDTGVLSLGPFTFANWYYTQYGRKEEGGVDLVRALMRSNDIFFYRLGELTGQQILAETSRKLGLGKKLGVDIPGEEAGVVPDDIWKRENIGEVWYPGDTLHMSIGQGYVLATPLQISNLISFIASNGYQFPPHLALKLTNENKQTLKEFKYDPITIKDINQADIELIKKGLSKVTKEGGTAWPFFNFPIQTAGKTGTAEFGHPKNKTHAWYTAFAPEVDPKIAVTVLLEAGGEGSTNASPVSKEIFRWYFSNDKNNLIKDIAPISTESARTLGE